MMSGPLPFSATNSLNGLGLTTLSQLTATSKMAYLTGLL